MTGRKIKIHFIITALGYGGAELVLFLLLKYIDRSLFEPKVFAVVRGGAFVERIERELGIEVVVLNKRMKLGLGVMWTLFWEFRRTRPDILHTHLFGGDTWGRIPAIFARVPVILATEHHTNYQENEIQRWVKRLLARFTDTIVCDSESVRDFAIRVDHIPSRKLQKIVIAVESDSYKSLEPPGFGGQTLGIVARLVPHKGHCELFQAIALLKSEFPLLHCLLVYGAQENEKALRELAKELSIEDRITWISKAENVIPYYQQMDIAIFPSYYEGLGLAIIEAMMSGRVVIGTHVEGIREVIDHDESGLLVPPKNPTALANAIRRVLTDQGLFERLRIKGREMALNKFSVQRFATAYQNLYLELLQSKT